VAAARDLATHAELTWLRHVSGIDLAMRELLARKLGALKAELGSPAPSPLERLMIDRIAINWLMVAYADLEAAETKDGDPRRADLALKRQTQAELRYATAVKALAAIRRHLPTTTSKTGAGPAATPADAGTQEDEAGPKSRRPKRGTAKAATVRDDRNPAKGAHAALLKLDRDDRERDG
jgi:hypothetical protein